MILFEIINVRREPVHRRRFDELETAGYLTITILRQDANSPIRTTSSFG
jgi:hypothetical protein